MSLFTRRRALILAVLVLVLSALFFVMRLSTAASMRKLRAASVVETDGYYIVPAVEYSGRIIPGDKAPVQAFEIVRPAAAAITIGRLATSCSCIKLESPKNTFAEGERAIVALRNVEETAGQMYSLFIQVTSPVQATLRRDVFVQSDHYLTHGKQAAAATGSEGKDGEDDAIQQRPSLTSLLGQLTAEPAKEDGSGNDGNEETDK